MGAEEIKDFVNKQPFRSFSVRLTNGAKYAFRERSDVGISKDFRTIVFFGEEGIVLISTADICEVFDNI